MLTRLSNNSNRSAVKSTWLTVKVFELLEVEFLFVCASQSSMSSSLKTPLRTMPFFALISGVTLTPISPRSILLIPFWLTMANFAAIELPKLALIMSCVFEAGFFSSKNGMPSSAVFDNGAGSFELIPIRLERMLNSVFLSWIWAFANQSVPPVTLLGNALNDFLRPVSVTCPWAEIWMACDLSVLMLNCAGPS